MLEMKHYRDIPSGDREAVFRKLSEWFVPGDGTSFQEVPKEMEHSEKGKLPQFLFLFREDVLVGYLFLIAEQENFSKAFPYWATHNLDELRTRGEDVTPCLEYAIHLCEECGALQLKSRLQQDPSYQKP